MVIGTIVKSNSHISYMCRVFGKLEMEAEPPPAQYSFGTFVRLVPDPSLSLALIGVVRDTILLNPEYGNLGPRLSTDDELAVLSPDYINEKGVLVDVLVLGWMEGDEVHHGVPALSAQIGTGVETLTDAEVHAFHRDRDGRFIIGYLPQLSMRNDPMIASLLLAILDRLEPAFPDGRRILQVLRTNVAWKARVVPAG